MIQMRDEIPGPEGHRAHLPTRGIEHEWVGHNHYTATLWGGKRPPTDRSSDTALHLTVAQGGTT